MNFILPFVLYFVSRRYIASVEPVETTDKNSIYPNEKSPSAIHPQALAFPSPILQNPDTNDVHMFNPDDNYSISIKRSSIRPSKHSQMESNIAYSPMMDKGGVPTIIYSDITSFNNDPIAPYSPNALAPGQNHLQPSISPSPSTLTSNTRNSANGLGISDPSSDNGSAKAPLYSQKALSSQIPVNTSSAPGSPRSFVSGIDRKEESTKINQRSPNMARLFNPIPKSPEISQAPPYTTSPSRPFHHNSILASAISFKSSVVAPEIDATSLTEADIKHENERFVAFLPKRWLNPFYLAIISCAALSVSVAFMIVYDITMLGLGNDVLS